jgi:plastocyanin
VIAATVAVVAAAALAAGIVAGMAMGSHGRHMGSRDADATPFYITSREAAIDIADFRYDPPNLVVDAGTTVTWTNRDSALHDATDRGKSWKTPLLAKGESASISFDTPGSFRYFCSVHPWMEGRLTVEDSDR